MHGHSCHICTDKCKTNPNAKHSKTQCLLHKRWVYQGEINLQDALMLNSISVLKHLRHALWAACGQLHTHPIGVT